MENEVSKRTITVLVILTVVVSMLGTLSVLSAAATIKSQNAASQSTESGWVGLNIKEGEKRAEQAPSPTGMVAFNILEEEI